MYVHKQFQKKIRFHKKIYEVFHKIYNPKKSRTKTVGNKKAAL